MTAYIALIRKDSTSDYGVEFPNFPGCVTAGTTLDDAGKMAAQALDLHIEGMAEGGDPIPAPTRLDIIMADQENRKAVAFLVDVAVRPVRAVRVNVMLPQDLEAEIDRTTKNRFRFLAEAARAKLGRAA